MVTTKKKATTADLVTRYNKAARALGRKPIKRFADRKSAERRVKAIEAELKPAARTSAAPHPDAMGTKRGLTFDLPGAKDKTPPREGTRRAALLGVLKAAGKKGVSFEKLHAKCGFKNRKSTRDALGLLSRKNGYGVVAEGETVRLK